MQFFFAELDEKLKFALTNCQQAVCHCSFFLEHIRGLNALVINWLRQVFSTDYHKAFLFKACKKFSASIIFPICFFGNFLPYDNKYAMAVVVVAVVVSHVLV